MRYTFSIDESSDKAIALLEYLRTLEFVKEENTEFVLTDKHKEILHERRANRMSGKSKSYSWDEIKESLGSKKAG
jgi:hypothetical protein